MDDSRYKVQILNPFQRKILAISVFLFSVKWRCYGYFGFLDRRVPYIKGRLFGFLPVYIAVDKDLIAQFCPGGLFYEHAKIRPRNTRNF